MMNDTKHTPGPWRAIAAKIKTGPQKEGDRLIASEGNHHIAECFQYRHETAVDVETALANARLIVAAVNSYGQLPNAIEAAEGDLLGEAMGALKEIARRPGPVYSSRLALKVLAKSGAPHA